MESLNSEASEGLKPHPLRLHRIFPGVSKVQVTASIIVRRRKRIYATAMENLEHICCDSIYSPSLPTNPRFQRQHSCSLNATEEKSSKNTSIHVPEPMVDLSPERRVRRVIDPQRECDPVVLGPVSSFSP
jgi:hypothetical protein